MTGVKSLVLLSLQHKLYRFYTHLFNKSSHQNSIPKPFLTAYLHATYDFIIKNHILKSKVSAGPLIFNVLTQFLKCKS